MTLPSDPAERKLAALMRACLDYFPDALVEVALVSMQGNKQHNGNEDVHWARGKSDDHADACVRHLMDRGKIDTDGRRHSGKAAWRALAECQEEIERERGLPPSRGSRPSPEKKPEPEQLELPFGDIQRKSASGDACKHGAVPRCLDCKFVEFRERYPDVADLPLEEVNSIPNPVPAAAWLKPKWQAPVAKRPKQNKKAARSKRGQKVRRR